MLNVFSAKGSSLTRFCRREEYSITADVLHMSLLAALLHSRTPSFSQKYTILERFLCDKRKPLSFLAIKARKSIPQRNTCGGKRKCFPHSVPPVCWSGLRKPLSTLDLSASACILSHPDSATKSKEPAVVRTCL